MLNILEICKEECAYLVWNKYKLSKTLCSLWSEIFHTGETFIKFVFKYKWIHCSCCETMNSTQVHWQRSSMKLRSRAVPKMWTDKSHAPHLPRLHLHATVAEILEGRLYAGRNRRKWPLMTCAQTDNVFLLFCAYIARKHFHCLWLSVQSNKCIVPSTVSSENMVR